MKKNLLIFNFIIILLLVVSYMLGHYFINYPMPFNFWYSVKESGFEYFPFILAATALIAYLVSSVSFKRSNFKLRFLTFYAIINFTVFVFIIITSGNELVKNQNELSKKETEYILQAQKDIKNDRVTFSYAGGLSFPVYNERVLGRIRDIRKRYGITYENTGCVIDPMTTEAQKKYRETVNPYLEKRNGKGWEYRMQQEINSLK
ncbi:FEKKY domain-containing protein [Chryseobacterium aureum]|uniref:FEKKY domain-containing protein n=1 Tax=Chryseobacterium aureum TaxID=2497456 RepID=UPI000F86152F|nr:hypothetical protein [Chryseobacterium aureum]